MHLRIISLVISETGQVQRTRLVSLKFQPFELFPILKFSFYSQILASDMIAHHSINFSQIIVRNF